MKIGLVGYGMGGRIFHAPFINAGEDVELVGVVARAPDKIALIRAEQPGIAIYSSLSEMIAAGGIDAVTIKSSPTSPSPPMRMAGGTLTGRRKPRAWSWACFITAAGIPTSRPCASLSRAIGSAACGVCIPEWISTIRRRSIRHRRAGCCGIWVVISSTRWRDCSARSPRSTRSSTR